MLTSKEIEELCKYFYIEHVPENRNYWLVRTNGGIYFDDFYSNGFISIGWDEFSSIEQMKNEKEEDVKQQIEKIYKDQKRPGYIYNQIKRFMFDLKKGDMVLIPSENSSMIAFGIITEEFYTVNNSVPNIALKKNPKCPFKKRIKIKWIKLLGKESFDPYMRMLMFAHSTVSNINEYKDNINRILYPIYVVGDKIHFTYEIKSEDNIPFSAFSNFLNIVSSSLNEFDKITGTISSNANISVKTSLNSPGVVEIIGLIFAGGFALTVINAFLFGGKFDTSILAIGKFSAETPGLLGTILKFIQEKNKNNTELQKLEKDYKIQQKLLKMKTPNGNHINSNDDSTTNN